MFVPAVHVGGSVLPRMLLGQRKLADHAGVWSEPERHDHAGTQAKRESQKAMASVDSVLFVNNAPASHRIFGLADTALSCTKKLFL